MRARLIETFTMLYKLYGELTECQLRSLKKRQNSLGDRGLAGIYEAHLRRKSTCCLGGQPAANHT